MLTTFRRHPVLASAFLLATLVMLAFAGSFAVRLVYWQIHAEEDVQAWMTVGYVGHSWGIKPLLIDETAGLPPPVDGHPLTLQEIADQRGVPVSAIISEVEAALEKLQARVAEPRP